MTLKRRQFTRNFKIQVLQEADSGKSVCKLAREHQVYPTLIHRWRQQLCRQGERAFPFNGRAVSDEARVVTLELKFGQLTMENDL